ncbi:uncharacterized protein PHACADRAFT_202393 [Phanerochaete carnosa HHB-10118-sp]|uniref:Uncharacterized protein n=1 Tax=Phanerochaete carnosa (strain HHB-10118-sp) TaxID=650164 RepID=K5VCK6_PHACS|nr:uncharacterized protein PHACADRAFT_206787 [Phanerochaete carnosa HHB-10118-sp]XP_007402656.1 uncharacterized protein PHACADRAFT_202393 [Phanerochaete carnosa HHB-10118-sp]EKM48793.1 hypothetical protein PHACADRAFT_202393 [Phanerochaete carnosa HHB-10118-sp]EKM57932.1 hypothetical protein PHACADRAFT_206787 [Phanerochaete carnosa HHB-10118-sp]
MTVKDAGPAGVSGDFEVQELLVVLVGQASVALFASKMPGPEETGHCRFVV